MFGDEMRRVDESYSACGRKPGSGVMSSATSRLKTPPSYISGTFVSTTTRKKTFVMAGYIGPADIAPDESSSASNRSDDSVREKGEERRHDWESRPNMVNIEDGGRKESEEERAEMRQGHLDEPTSNSRGSDTQQDKLKQAFQIFDRDGDGRITRAEMSRAMQSLGYHPTEQEIAEMLDNADFNRNGTIEFEEFVQVMSSGYSTPIHNTHVSADGELQAIFEIFDLDKNGRITAEELRYVMGTLGENVSKNELDEMMRIADTNGDGTIDFKEFQELFQLDDQEYEATNRPFPVITHCQ